VIDKGTIIVTISLEMSFQNELFDTKSTRVVISFAAMLIGFRCAIPWQVQHIALHPSKDPDEGALVPRAMQRLPGAS
jgi:hypothetical protein